MTAQQSPLPKRFITLELIRKRSEHNAGLVSNLEELALHQEELQSIGPVLGRTCGKTLKILLLQNNVIERMIGKELKFFKSLDYLNLALNNIHCIERGSLSGMECLRKLDLTLNFIDVDCLELSVDELVNCESLRELFLIGNPCMGSLHADSSCSPESVEVGDKSDTHSSKSKGWQGCRAYIIAKLPNLEYLDGIEIKISERIVALQQLPMLTAQLGELARQHENEQQKLSKDTTNNDESSSYISDEARTQHNPETRTKISNEAYDQKMAKEKKASENTIKQKGEKEWKEEHETAIERARGQEEKKNSNCQIKQCNQGNYTFWFEEESSKNGVKTLILRVDVPKHLSTSLIDVDIHPNHVVIVIKNKILRLKLPVEVVLKGAIARRSSASGNLELVMPKLNPKEIVLGLRNDVDVNNNAKKTTATDEQTKGVSGSKGKSIYRKERGKLGMKMMDEVTHLVKSRND